MKYDVALIAEQFEISGRFLDAVPYGSGHINDSFLIICEHGEYLLQRINHNVFADPVSLMDNVSRVTRHIRSKLEAAGATDIGRKVLTLVPTCSGGCFYRDEAGNYWRMYMFVEQTVSYDRAPLERHAYEAADAFGQFQNLLSDLAVPPLHETISDFHNTPKRFDALVEAVENDVCNRAVEAKEEIEFAFTHRPIASTITDLIADQSIPLRVIHNDTKLNNVLFDEAQDTALCIVDLDTTMPGTVLYDFGDMVRSMTCSSDEASSDPSNVCMKMSMFEAIVGGYLLAAGNLLNETERGLLVFSGKLISLETGIRFLTDHLMGDKYFKIHRPNHNLDRCRTQFKLVESIEDQEESMNKVVDSFLNHG